MLQVIKPVANIHATKVQTASRLAGNLQAANGDGELLEGLFTLLGLANRRFATQAGLGNVWLAAGETRLESATTSPKYLAY